MKDNKPIAAFFDTNIFHHYQPIDQIKWSEILGGEVAVIVIASSVLRELDKHKDEYTRTRIRNRARKAINFIESTVGSVTTIADGLNVRVELLNHPGKEHFVEGLSEGNSDDELVAACLMFGDANPDYEVILVAHDSGPRIKARLRGLRVEQLPDECRLPDEVDAETKEIQRLKSEILNLQNRLPRLAFRFSNGEEFLRHNLLKPFTKSVGDTEDEMASLHKEYPSIRGSLEAVDNEESISPNMLDLLAKVVPVINTPSIFGSDFAVREIRRYDDELLVFFDNYRIYLEEHLEEENLHRLSIEIQFVLENAGNAVASEIDLFLHFPDGFDLLNSHQYPKAILKPKAPALPRPASELMDFRVPDISHLRNYNFARDTSAPIPNVSKPNIRRTNSFDVKFEVGRLKQNMNVSFDSLYVVFEDDDTAKSFAIDYRINCVELPDEIVGKLNIVVNRPEG